MELTLEKRKGILRTGIKILRDQKEAHKLILAKAVRDRDEVGRESVQARIDSFVKNRERQEKELAELENGEEE